MCADWICDLVIIFQDILTFIKYLFNLVVIRQILYDRLLRYLFSLCKAVFPTSYKLAQSFFCNYA